MLLCAEIRYSSNLSPPELSQSKHELTLPETWPEFQENSSDSESSIDYSIYSEWSVDSVESDTSELSWLDYNTHCQMSSLILRTRYSNP